MAEGIEMLLHRQLKEIRTPDNGYDEFIDFVTQSGSVFRMQHIQDCCESVTLEEVIGDLDDLVGAPILLAECVQDDSEESKPGQYAESWTWTFYKLATHKGHVTLRWLGESNGYYSESVDFDLIKLSGADYFAHQTGALRLPYKDVDRFMEGGT